MLKITHDIHVWIKVIVILLENSVNMYCMCCVGREGGRDTMLCTTLLRSTPLLTPLLSSLLSSPLLSPLLSFPLFSPLLSSPLFSSQLNIWLSNSHKVLERIPSKDRASEGDLTKGLLTLNENPGVVVDCRYGCVHVKIVPRLCSVYTM